MLKCCALLSTLAILSSPVLAGEVFSKPGDPAGGLNPSAWVFPNGSDSDEYAWDDFSLAETQVLTEVRWRGGYSLGAPYGHATDFRVSFFNSDANGFQPLITALPSHESQETVIATFHTNGLAGESFAGVFGGMVMYDYVFRLPAPVTIPGTTRCWFRVLASQTTWPDWGMATGLGGVGGDNAHFRYTEGTHTFRNWPHDLAFSLHADWVNLGHSLSGTAGAPELTGTGSLAGGSSATVSLSLARPSSPAWFVVGLTQVDLPFSGGILVPAPTIILPLATDSTGSVSLTFGTQPGVPSGIDLVLQTWIADPLATAGRAASNGLVSTTP